MDEQAEVEKYNYSEFVGSEEFLAFRTHLPVGSLAPDFEATLLVAVARAMRVMGSLRPRRSRCEGGATGPPNVCGCRFSW